MGTIYALLGLILAGMALGCGWNIGGQLASASLRMNSKKPYIAASIIALIVLAAVILNKIPLPF